MKLCKYENAICDIEPALLRRDEYCFSVLSRILQGECRLTLTDKERLVICHSCDPFPVWIWLPDDATEREKSDAYEAVKTYFGLDGKYRFNTKYFFAEYMIARAREENFGQRIAMNMLAYNCLAPVAPKKTPDGEWKIAGETDLETAVGFMESFHEDVAIDQRSVGEYRQKAQALIAEKKLFFWIDEQGEAVAMCSYHVSADKGSVGNVFTRRDKRRKGYAAKLVYEVTRLILREGLIPALYTDADYAASNACYESIGYCAQGSLCTVGAEK